MGTTIEKVRAAMVAGAALVAMLVAGFLVVAHVRSHRLLRGLPGRLGADIQKETNGFTYSQSVKGRTIFTLHAAKATQHKDGRTGLHDVGIVLYGEKDGRADRIYGKDFEYDQRNGIVRAEGEVQLDLQAPAPTTADARASFARGGNPPKGEVRGQEPADSVHVITSGLVYVQSLGVASTDQPIRFSYRGMTGQSHGASYHATTGVTTLEREVRLAGLRDGRPTVLTADHAELDRAHHRMTLTAAHYLLLGKTDNDRSTGERMTAALVVIRFAEGGGIESLEASDGVELAADGGMMRSPQAEVRLTAESRPQTVRMSGGVRFASGDASTGDARSQVQGSSEEAEARFDAQGQLSAIHLKGGVQASTREAEGDGAQREIAGKLLDLRFGGAARDRRYVQEATLRGDARLRMTSAGKSAHDGALEEARADVLLGLWQQTNRGAVLHEVTGTGRTEVHRVEQGVEEVSRGDRLHATFAQAAQAKLGAAAQPSGGVRGGIEAASQEGGVTMERTVHGERGRRDGSKEETAGTRSGTSVRPERPEGAADAEEVMRGRANTVLYDAPSGRITLTGGAEISQASGTLRATRIDTAESSGDAEAEGAVQLTYRQQADGAELGKVPATHADAEPLHAVGAHAWLRHNADTVTIHGAEGQRARLWQGASQVEAPVLVFARSGGTLEAYGDARGESLPVRTVLARQSGVADVAAGTAVGTKVTGARPADVLRVRSGRLRYTQAAQQAEFSDGVLLADTNGTISSRDAVAVLHAKTQSRGGTGESGKAQHETGEREAGRQAVSRGLFRGALESLVATGDVVLREPGRLATGAELRYLAESGEFVLTGSTGAPPTLVDEGKGSVSGSALRFHAGDNSVRVEGRAAPGVSPSGDGRVHTRTRVKR